MQAQTQDNLRCLAATVFLLVLTAVESLAQSILVPSWPGWISFAFFMILLPVVTRTFNPRRTTQPNSVYFDNTQITRIMPDGKFESVRWDDLQEVGIVTTDEGPSTEDVFWMLIGTHGGCAIPSGAQGMKELLPRLQQLPGFDNGTVIKAMGSTRNDKFQCWKRTPEHRA